MKENKCSFCGEEQGGCTTFVSQIDPKIKICEDCIDSASEGFKHF